MFQPAQSIARSLDETGARFSCCLKLRASGMRLNTTRLPGDAEN